MLKHFSCAFFAAGMLLLTGVSSADANDTPVPSSLIDALHALSQTPDFFETLERYSDRRTDLETVVREAMENNPSAFSGFTSRSGSTSDAVVAPSGVPTSEEARLSQQFSFLFNDAVPDLMGELVATDDPTFGSGEIRIIEFFDYNCGFCKQSAAVIAQLKTDRRVTVVHKHYPRLGEASSAVARLSIAMHMLNPDTYLKFHTALMSHRGRLDAGNAIQIASELGVDVAALTARADSDEVTDKLRANARIGARLGILGTPFTYVEHIGMSGARPVEHFLMAIEYLLNR